MNGWDKERYPTRETGSMAEKQFQLFKEATRNTPLENIYDLYKSPEPVSYHAPDRASNDAILRKIFAASGLDQKNLSRNNQSAAFLGGAGSGKTGIICNFIWAAEQCARKGARLGFPEIDFRFHAYDDISHQFEVANEVKSTRHEPPIYWTKLFQWFGELTMRDQLQDGLDPVGYIRHQPQSLIVEVPGIPPRGENFIKLYADKGMKFFIIIADPRIREVAGVVRTIIAFMDETNELQWNEMKKVFREEGLAAFMDPDHPLGELFIHAIAKNNPGGIEFLHYYDQYRIDFGELSAHEVMTFFQRMAPQFAIENIHTGWLKEAQAWKRMQQIARRGFNEWWSYQQSQVQFPLGFSLQMIELHKAQEYRDLQLIAIYFRWFLIERLGVASEDIVGVFNQFQATPQENPYKGHLFPGIQPPEVPPEYIVRRPSVNDVSE